MKTCLQIHWEQITRCFHNRSSDLSNGGFHHPGGLATDVALDSNITIEFSESVTLVPDSFLIFTAISAANMIPGQLLMKRRPVIVINRHWTLCWRHLHGTVLAQA
jgi:hypothetical protein